MSSPRPGQDVSTPVIRPGQKPVMKPRPSKPAKGPYLPVIRPAAGGAGQTRNMGGIAKGGKGSKYVNPTYNTY